MVVVICGGTIVGQSSATTYYGTVATRYQHEVDSFLYYYPEVTRIAGNLFIYGNEYAPDSFHITNLDGFQNIERVAGSLAIEKTVLLEDLSGLENLDTIGYTLSLYQNPRLRNTDALEGLIHQGGGYVGVVQYIQNDSLERAVFPVGITKTENLQIRGNPKLEALPDMVGLDSVMGQLSIGSNSTIEDLSGLNDLSYVESMYISGADQLTTLDGLDSLAKFGNRINIYDNEKLKDVVSLNKVSTVQPPLWVSSAYLSFSNCPELDSLPNFYHIDSLTRLRVNRCDKLTTINGIDSVPIIKSIEIVDNDGIVHIDLPHLKYNNSLVIYENENLLSAGSFAALERGRGHVLFEANPNLLTINGFHNFRDSLGSLEIYRNDNLLSIDVFRRTPATKYSYAPGAYFDYNDNIYISGTPPAFPGEENHSIVSLNGFDSLRHAGGLVIQRTELTDINGFNNLVSVGKRYYSIADGPDLLGIIVCPELQELSGFQNLRTVLRQLSLIGAPLQHLDIFPSLDTIGVAMPHVSSNIGLYLRVLPNVQHCEFCDWLEHYHANVYIIGNDALQSWSALQSFPASEALNKISILNNPQLVSLPGYPGPNNFGFITSSIKNNPQLTDLSGLCRAFEQSNDISLNGIAFENNHSSTNSLDSVLHYCSFVSSTTEPEQREWSRVYPNPTAGELTVELPADQFRPVDLTLYSLTGTPVLSAPLETGGTTQISLYALPPGVYLLRLDYDDGHFEAHRIQVLR